MGYLKNRHGFNMLGATPLGTCPECGRAHAEEMPHDQQSLAYQYKFYDQHGRWPTWADAMAHCMPEIKDLWAASLKEKGIDVEEEPGTVVLDLSISLGEEDPDA